jgi:hypothetical protein
MFAKKLKAEARIYFARTKDEFGRDAHYFVNVTPTKEAAFLKAMQGSALVDYSNFGDIVASGFGHTPSTATLQKLKDDFNYTPLV